METTSLKKKTAILTMPLHANFGGILQAWALQTFLKAGGYDAYRVDLQFSRHSALREAVEVAKRLTKRYLLNRKIDYLFDSGFSAKNKRIIAQHTSEFINKYINPKTAGITGVENLATLAGADFDAWIVGSDQVWRPLYCDVEKYFLGFLPPGKKVKRISYAASFGVDTWEYNEQQTAVCRKLAGQFDALSVREDSGVTLCREKLGVTALQVVDPTLLLTPHDYLKLIGNPQADKSARGELLVYMLDNKADKEKAISQIAAYYNYKPFITNNPKTEIPSAPVKERVAPSVESWLEGYAGASYVITDSFHGVVFSLLFNVPFIVYGNKTRGMARITSLLNLFGLEDRLIYSANELTEGIIAGAVDWNKVNEKIHTEREKSMNFLKNSIG